jgi:hypothetical protein
MSQQENWGNTDGSRSALTDTELDRAIIATLAVCGAEYRTGRSMRAGLTAEELALETSEPLARVETHLRDLARAGRIAAPADEQRDWSSRTRLR